MLYRIFSISSRAQKVELLRQHSTVVPCREEGKNVEVEVSRVDWW
jgi:hypothetical protein